MTSERTAQFKKNLQLEAFLESLNKNLWPSETGFLKNEPDKINPVIFIVGPFRSGSTLFLQWLSATKLFTYPTNLMSRFYRAPIVGAYIQQLLTDPRYNFRDELSGFTIESNYESENGKTKGLLEPNEFWFFWHRFLDFGDLDYLSDAQLECSFDKETFYREILGIAGVFDKPFALKANIMNYSIPFLNSIFDKAVFVQLKRNPATNIASGLSAREKQHGNLADWYSYKLPEYESLNKLPAVEQVAGQIYCINRAVDKGMAQIPEHKKMLVQYEDFCDSPATVFQELAEKLRKNGTELKSKYQGVESFTVSRDPKNEPELTKIYRNVGRNL